MAYIESDIGACMVYFDLLACPPPSHPPAGVTPDLQFFLFFFYFSGGLFPTPGHAERFSTPELLIDFIPFFGYIFLRAKIAKRDVFRTFINVS